MRQWDEHTLSHDTRTEGESALWRPRVDGARWNSDAGRVSPYQAGAHAGNHAPELQQSQSPDEPECAIWSNHTNHVAIARRIGAQNLHYLITNPIACRPVPSDPYTFQYSAPRTCPSRR